MALNIQMFAWWPLQLWNSCRINGTMECDAIVTSCFKPWMYCCFCRMPSAEISTVLELVLLLWWDCKANVLQVQVMSCFCSTQSTLLSKVCILLVFNSVMYCISLTFSFFYPKLGYIIICQFHSPSVQCRYFHTF